MEWKVLLKSPETKAGPPKGASEEGQCQIQPHKRKGLGQGVSTKVNALKNYLQKSWGHRKPFLMPPYNRPTASSTLALKPKTCPLKKACDFMGELLVWGCQAQERS